MGTITPNVGLITGFPITQTVDQLIALQARPRDLLVQLAAKVEAEQVATTDVASRLLALQFQAINLSSASLFSQRSVSSSNPSLLSVSSTGTPPLGNFQFTPLATAQSHQLLSSGLASATDPLGGGELSFRFGGYIDSDTALEVLNGGAGIEQGKFRITDRSGASAIVDLRFARSVDDVVEAVNTASEINVTLEARADHFALVDNTGGSGNLKVEEITGGTAASLGLGGVDVAAAEALGSDVFSLFDGLALSLLNDGNGVRFDEALPELEVHFRDGSAPLIIDFHKLGDAGTQAAATTNAANGTDAEVVFTAVEAGTSLNGVTIQFEDDPGVTFGQETVFYDENTKTLTFQIDEGNTNANHIVAALNDDATASEVFTAALSTGSSGLGLVTTSDTTTTTGGVDPVADGNEQTIGDVLETLNAADPARLKAEIAANGDRIVLTDLTADLGATFEVQSLFGTVAREDLGLAGTAVGDKITGDRLHGGLKSSLLRNLGGTSGLGDLGVLSLTDRSGVTNTINLSSAETVDEVLALINFTSVGIEARINKARNGIELVDTTGSTASNLIVANGDATNTADKLQLAVDAAVTSVNSGSLDRRVLSENTRLDDLNGGRGIVRGKFTVTVTDGTSATVDLTDPDIATIGDVLQRIDQLGLALTARINDTGDGILLIDEADGSGLFTVEDVTGSSARDLHLTGAAQSVQIGGETEVVIDGRTTFTVTLGANDSLEDLVEQINDLGAGVSASKFVDGSIVSPFRLSLLSQQSGEAGALLIDASGIGLSFTETAAAQDALLLFGTPSETTGGVIAASSDGTFSDVLPDVNVTVQGATGETVNISVTKSETSLLAGIDALVASYNDLQDRIDELTAFDEVTLEAGLLLGDGNLLRVETDLANLLTGRFFGVGSIESLGAVGLSLDDEGRLVFDQSVFDAALADDPDAVEEFFTKQDVGFADKLNSLIETLAGSESSLLINRIDTLGNRLGDLNDKIEFWDERLEKSRELLLNQFALMEQAIAEQQNNLAALSALQILPPLPVGTTT